VLELRILYKRGQLKRQGHSQLPHVGHAQILTEKNLGGPLTLLFNMQGLSL